MGSRRRYQPERGVGDQLPDDAAIVPLRQVVALAMGDVSSSLAGSATEAWMP